jgi:hypothetical protein
MEIKIKLAENGYIIENIYNKEEDTEVSVYSDFKDVLNYLISEIEPGSRHDEKRFYVIEAPGDKHPSFTDEHARVIWREDEVETD